jgi:hypothetical protein
MTSKDFLGLLQGGDLRTDMSCACLLAEAASPMPGSIVLAVFCRPQGVRGRDERDRMLSPRQMLGTHSGKKQLHYGRKKQRNSRQTCRLYSRQAMNLGSKMPPSLEKHSYNLKKGTFIRPK